VKTSAVLAEAALQLEQKGYGSTVWWITNVVHPVDVAQRQSCRCAPRVACDECEAALSFVDEMRGDTAMRRSFELWVQLDERIVALSFAAALAEDAET
jgi:hypothetical protein